MSVLWTVYWLQSSPTQPLQAGEELHISQTPFNLSSVCTSSPFSFSWSFHLSFLYLNSHPTVHNYDHTDLSFLFLYTKSFSFPVLLELAAGFLSVVFFCGFLFVCLGFFLVCFGFGFCCCFLVCFLVFLVVAGLSFFF